ncbi:Rrf2 family transcriptional regulator [Salibacterium qingdaonense]|uniref:Transcriptional regulator, BadM/Rrf2 family n=1 Tax=Salibacterium qingdaonense TaxID=266892 RepID=A0A1I4N5F3_9BACI|nr:Rrf2 family transcriptional regulator [Salibacterium qingdaonense]SFM10718.1 transcriptional regulator, BadM/Rrf2 family [Salibacterium qingdaonense]
MKFSKATNYALHTMLYFVVTDPKQQLGVQPLAEKMEISPTYLSKILTQLVKAGLVESASGAKGGYRLPRGWESISFLDIIHAVEGPVSLFDGCLNDNPECMVKQVMVSAEDKMEEELKQRTLADFAESAPAAL